MFSTVWGSTRKFVHFEGSGIITCPHNQYFRWETEMKWNDTKALIALAVVGNLKA